MAPLEKDLNEALIRKFDGNIWESQNYGTYIEKHQTDNRGRWKKILNDRQYREKFVKTVSFWWSFFVYGWITAQFGPAFPDLRLILGVDLETASFLFTVGWIGYMFGSVVSGIIYDRVKECCMKVLTVGTLGVAVTTGLLPWYSSFPFMLCMRALAMFLCASTDTVLNAEMMAMWKGEEKGLFYILHLMYPLGAVVSPLATEPFLATPGEISVQSELNNNQIDVFLEINISDAYNVNDINATLPNTNPRANLMAVNGTKGFTDLNSGDTSVQYAFLITASLSATIALSAIIIQCCFKRSREITGTVMEQLHKSVLKYSLKGRRKIILIVLLALFYALFHAVHDTFYSYAMTFCLTQLKWTKYMGSLATSLYFASEAAGRVLALFIISHVHSAALVIISLTFAIMSFSLLLIGSIYSLTPLIWAAVCGCGFGQCCIFPSSINWLQDHVMHVSGKISSIIMIACSVGSMINPLFLGTLMETISPMWYLYLMLIQIVAEFVVFMIVFILANVKPYAYDQLDT